MWAEIVASMFLEQENDILIVFLLKILARGLFLGKCLSMSLRNSFPNLVFIARLNVGLYQIIFLFLALFLFLLFELLCSSSVGGAYFILGEKPLFFSAAS